jgi:hypothetical protein
MRDRRGGRPGAISPASDTRSVLGRPPWLADGRGAVIDLSLMPGGGQEPARRYAAIVRR